ncbi:MAG: UbiD family decarboxylase [Dehalococcoidales bacterium]|nr:UbiD family decarboxylase [Dehalococcoidales bacterium]
MAYTDNRKFIEALDKTGDIVHIKQEVDWDLEVGAIGRLAYQREGPAIVFENIKDYPGHRIFSGMLGTFRRVAIALDMPPETPIRDIYAEYAKRIEKTVKPVVVDSAPCQENVILGDDVDLNKLPTPYLHDGDGGRYIATWAFEVTKDPDTGLQNWGMYRFMIHNKHYITGWPRVTSHLGMVLHGKYVPANKPMPMAVVIGGDPASNAVSTVSYGVEVDEADYAGAWNQKPIEMVKCKTIDLMVPANAEIILEGELQPDRVTSEGPFGEYPGFRTEGMRSGTLCKIKAITHRNSPIFTTIQLGVPPDDSSVLASMTAAVAMKRGLLRHNVPVTDVYAPPHGVTHLIIVGVNPGGKKVVDQVRDYFMTRRRVDPNKIMVVDEADPFNWGEVMHDFSTKCHPLRGVEINKVEYGANPLTPCYSAEERRHYTGGLDVFDCTWPAEADRFNEIPVRNSFKVMYPEEVKNKVLKNWKNYGFKD